MLVCLFFSLHRNHEYTNGPSLVVIKPQTTQPERRRTARRVLFDVPSPATQNRNEFAQAVSGTPNTIAEDDDVIPTTPAKKLKRSSHRAETASIFSSPLKKVAVVDDENTPPVPIPQTPRHKNRVQKLPVTPRHRISVVGKPMTPRSVPGTPKTPRRWGEDFAGPKALGEARALFARGATPGKLVGRDEERGRLRTYLGSRIEGGKGGCLYMSGPPGTGKSALLNEVLGELESQGAVRKAVVNCMVMQDPKGIYATLLQEFWETGMEEVRSRDGLEELQGIFMNRKSKTGSGGV